MSARIDALTRKIEAFNHDMVALVRGCSDDDWRKVCQAEDWSVGVVARHVGDGHYRVVELAKMIISGTPLPEWSMEDVVRMGNDHAREHADCSKAEVLSILEDNSRALTAYITALTEDELDRKAQMALIGGEVSAQQILEMLILHSGGEHLESMRATISS